jgi:hypothetical protein
MNYKTRLGVLGIHFQIKRACGRLSLSKIHFHQSFLLDTFFSPLFPSIRGVNFIRRRRMKFGVVFLFAVFTFQKAKHFPPAFAGESFLSGRNKPQKKATSIPLRINVASSLNLVSDNI